MDTAAAINAVSGDNLYKKGINNIEGLRHITECGLCWRRKI